VLSESLTASFYSVQEVLRGLSVSSSGPAFINALAGLHRLSDCVSDGYVRSFSFRGVFRGAGNVAPDRMAYSRCSSEFSNGKGDKKVAGSRFVLVLMIALRQRRLRPAFEIMNRVWVRQIA
jgi:hypothetical protein